MALPTDEDHVIPSKAPQQVLNEPCDTIVFSKYVFLTLVTSLYPFCDALHHFRMQ